MLILAIGLVKEWVPKRQNSHSDLKQGEEMAEALGAASGEATLQEEGLISQRRRGTWRAVHRDHAAFAS